MRKNFISSFGRVLMIGFALLASQTVYGEDATMTADLNKPLKDIAKKDRSATLIFAAYLKMTPPPMEIGEDFNQTTIWNKMERWSEVSKWAQANSAMGEALIAAQYATVFGLQYGTKGVDPAWVKAGVTISFGDGTNDGRMNCNYFRAIRTMGAYATAEMYRLGEAGKFEAAFAVGIAYARILRQVCEQSMLEEKLFGLENLSENLSIHRDFMWGNLDRLPVDVMQKVALKEYSFLKPADNEKLRRLQMPEGDQIVASAVINRALKSTVGNVDPEQFANVIGEYELAAAPLQTFGTQEMWRRISTVHGSLEASEEKLKNVYDDWWRRWRLRPDSIMQKTSTEISRTNPIKYGIVVTMVRDLARAFAWRDAVIAEVNGTVVAAGLCGYYRDFKNTWPKSPERAYAVSIPKRFDFDPYEKSDAKSKMVPHLKYRALSARQAISTPYGPVWATGCMLWAIGANHEDDNGATHSVDGSVGDLVLWPPVRALARQEGLLK